jgi:serine/threonine protein kinase
MADKDSHSEFSVPGDLPPDPTESLRPTEHTASETLAKLIPPEMPSSAETGVITGSKAARIQDAAAAARGAAYVLREVIARGGHGEVWDAVQVALNRRVAVKRIRSAHYQEQEKQTVSYLEASFHKEAVVTGRLDHPTIVPVYDLGSDQLGRPMMAMKLVEGVAWNELLARDRSMDEVSFIAKHLPILVSVAHAVAFAHSRGIIHRDLKPSQVMVGQFGEVFLMDWGLAVLFENKDSNASALSFAPTIENCFAPAGTACYMAPEQTEPTGLRLGPWTDVYLLGGILYLILTDTYPHPQIEAGEAFRHAAFEDVEPPEQRSLLKYIPLELSAICQKAMSREFGSRHSSVEEFISEVEDYLTGANRRRESERLTEAAATKMISASVYSDYSAVDSLLTEAIALAPSNLRARGLQQQLLDNFGQRALAMRDLGLARVLAARIASPDTRRELLHHVDLQESIMRRQARQRKQAIGLSFILVLLLGGLAYAHIRITASARIHEAHLRKINSARDFALQSAQSAAQAQQKQAALFAKARNLHEHETRLAFDIAQVLRNEFPLPSMIRLTDYDRQEWQKLDPASMARFRSELASLEKLRNELIASGLQLQDPPHALLFGAAVIALKDARTPDDFKNAILRFEKAGGGHPQHAREAVGIATAYFEQGNTTSATAYLDQAAFYFRKAHGFRGDFQKIMTLEAETARKASSGVQLNPDDLIIETRPQGKNFDHYQELSGSWMDSNSPADWAKSMASGLSSCWDCGSRALRFFAVEDIRRSFPGIARFYPRLSSRQHRFVYVSWPITANASPVHYIVHHANGETTVSVVQDGWRSVTDGNANRWVQLGDYDFTPGEDQYVELQVNSDVRAVEGDWNGQVQADSMLFASSPISRAAAPDSPLTISTHVRWYDNLTSAEAASITTAKPVLVFFYCPSHPYSSYCSYELLRDQSLASYINSHFIALRVHPHGNTSIPESMRERPIGEFAICDSDGSLVHDFLSDKILTPSVLLQNLTAYIAQEGGSHAGN